MILIGQFDSPFVRRVGIALDIYGLPYEHRTWSTFGDADRLASFNPLRRVPTLVPDDGEPLIDSVTILDWLDETVGPERALIAQHGPGRRAALKVCALATGLANKAVSLLYERIPHEETSQIWVDRCLTQIADVLNALEADRATRPGAYWFGEKIGHADIAVACTIRFTREAHPGLFDPLRWTALAAHAARCEGLERFRHIVQPLNTCGVGGCATDLARVPRWAAARGGLARLSASSSSR
jgi:glutathione S-transferase